MDAPRERRTDVAGADGLVRGRSGDVHGARRHTEDVFGPDAVDDLRSVPVSRHRNADLQAGRHVALPAVVGQDVSLPLHETVADATVARAADVQLHAPDVPAVRHVVKQGAVRLRHIHRLVQPEIHVVLYHSAGVARRELDGGDDLVQRVVRINLTEY